MLMSDEIVRDGNEWVFPDGKRLPVISGGSDEGLVATPAEAAPAAEAPAAAPVETSAPAPAVEHDPFDSSDLGNEGIVPRGRYDKIAKEGQAYREQARALEEQLATYEQVYGQYEAEDRDAWFAMANEWARDPRAGAEMMQRIAEAVLNEGKTPEEATEQVIAEDQVAAAAEQSGQTLTPQQVEQIVAERLAAEKAEREQEQAIESIFSEIRAAGFDPQTRAGHSILWTANNETGGDIAKAVEIVQAERQKIIDEYVSGKASTPSPMTAPDAGMLATQAPEVHNLEDAFKASREFLKGIASTPG
jgi:uncharacterized protein (UPF0335 family)